MMISKYDVIQYSKSGSENCWFRIDNDRDVIDKTKNEYICDIDTLLEVLREKMHCNFECIYECHGLLQVVFRCKECGTVIFSTEDEDYDPNLCCPVCGEYKTHFEFWSGEEIKNDPKKLEEIKFLEQMQKEQNEAYERRKRRNGKSDKQIGNFTIKTKKHGIKFELNCDNLFKTRLKGLHLKIVWMDRNDGFFVHRKWFNIPLSISYIIQEIKFLNIRKNNPDFFK